MSKLHFLHSGGDKVTLETPASNPSTNPVFKLPQEDGSSGQFLKTDGSGALSFATPSPAAGTIIQVVSTPVDSTDSIALSTQYSYYPITPLDTTITTTRANSKILVSAGIGGEANHEDYHLAFRCGRVIGGSLQIIFKGADSGSRTTALAMGNTGYFADDQNSTTAYNSFANMLDSPSQAAGTAITYRFFVSTLAGNNATYFLNRTVNDGNDATKERLFSYLTLMEVAA